MSHWIFMVVFLVGVVSLVTCCYDDCMQKFSIEMDTISESTNNSGLITTDFCRAMSNQIKCLHDAVITCPPQQRALIESLLSVFIQPDYRRTCSGGNSTSANEVTINTTTSVTTPSTIDTKLPNTAVVGPHLNAMMRNSYSGIIPTSGRTLFVCRQKFQSCQIEFNNTFTANMARYNISGLCQSLKQYTICFLNLLSSECGHLVPRNLIYNMQTHYGGMCSTDAQANSYTMIECANLTMKCYIQFNSSFTPAVGDYNLMIMCSALDNYTTCMHNVSHTDECSQFIRQGLQGIQQLKKRHNAYCGDDKGKTVTECVQSFQACYSPFNKTFFPGLHTANLTLICGSLSAYASCVSRLSPTCSQQFGQVLQSVQTLKMQFAQKCHPNMIKLVSCQEVGQCSHVFMNSYAMGATTGSGLCGSIGDYFPCIEKSLDACNLPQSTTEVEFGGLGTLMKGYCHKLSSNTNLVQCSAFVKCTAAIWMTFTPSIRNLYEGSTWCTFLQLSIGCAEHALQSSGCSLEGDTQLRQNIKEIDQLRVQICEKDKNGGRAENEVDPGFYKSADPGNGNSSSSSRSSTSTLTATLFLFVFIKANMSNLPLI